MQEGINPEHRRVQTVASICNILHIQILRNSRNPLLNGDVPHSVERRRRSGFMFYAIFAFVSSDSHLIVASNATMS